MTHPLTVIVHLPRATRAACQRHGSGGTTLPDATRGRRRRRPGSTSLRSVATWASVGRRSRSCGQQGLDGSISSQPRPVSAGAAGVGVLDRESLPVTGVARYVAAGSRSAGAVTLDPSGNGQVVMDGRAACRASVGRSRRSRFGRAASIRFRLAVRSLGHRPFPCAPDRPCGQLGIV